MVRRIAGDIKDNHGHEHFLYRLQSKINQAIENSPAKDIEKNVKSMMTQGFSTLDLVTREEFDMQAQVLAKTRAKLEALEARLAELETRLNADKSVDRVTMGGRVPPPLPC